MCVLFFFFRLVSQFVFVFFPLFDIEKKMANLKESVDAVSYYLQRSAGHCTDSFQVFQEVFVPSHKIAFHFDSANRIQVIRTESSRETLKPQSYWAPPALNPKLQEIKITQEHLEACYLHLIAQEKTEKLKHLLAPTRSRSEYSDSKQFM